MRSAGTRNEVEHIGHNESDAREGHSQLYFEYASRQFGEHFGAPTAYHDDVLQPQAEFSLDIDPWFDRKNIPLVEHCLGAGRDIGLLMDIDPASAMTSRAALSMVLADTPGLTLAIAASTARSSTAWILQLRPGLTAIHHARNVARIAIHPATDVDQNGIA